MPTSQNGWPANDVSRTQSYKVPGSARAVRCVKGDAGELLTLVAAWVHANVEPIDHDRVPDDWGYAERPIRGSSTTLSNHASGTAIDFNAEQHPLGVHGTWSTSERTKVNAMLNLLDGTVRWGDNYSGRKDGMHFEINVNDDTAGLRKIRAAVATMRGLLAGGQGGGGAVRPATLEYPSKNGQTIAASSINYAAQGGYFHSGQAAIKEDVDIFLGLWRRHHPADLNAKVTRDLRIYGQLVRAADWTNAGKQFAGILRSFQAGFGLEPDGVFGPMTAAVVAHFGYGVTAKYEGPDAPPKAPEVKPPLGDLVSLAAIEYAANGGYFHVGQKPMKEDAEIVAAWMRRFYIITARDERVWRHNVAAADWVNAGKQYAGLIRKYQSKYDLAVDGIVGPATKAKLKAHLVHYNYRVVD